MAKIEFSEQELEVLKKVAEEYHKSGAGKAKEMLTKSGITFEISDNIKGDCSAPGVDGGDGCFACIVCLVLSLIGFIGFNS